MVCNDRSRDRMRRRRREGGERRRKALEVPKGKSRYLHKGIGYQAKFLGTAFTMVWHWHGVLGEI